MKSTDILLNEALEKPAKESLATHAETIKTLREKNYSWRDIADFLNKNGVATDHTKVFRFMKNWNEEANNFIDFFVPSWDQYVNALRESPVANPATERAKAQRAMLLFHYAAHNRTVTYTQLANAVGSNEYRTANNYYGRLGKFLGEELEMNFAISGKTGNDFYSSAIGFDNPFKSPKQEYQLVMHHELAKAIEALGWA